MGGSFLGGFGVGKTIFARSAAVGTVVWVLFPGRAGVALVWTGETGGRGIRSWRASNANIVGDGTTFS